MILLIICSIHKILHKRCKDTFQNDVLREEGTARRAPTEEKKKEKRILDSNIFFKLFRIYLRRNDRQKENDWPSTINFPNRLLLYLDILSRITTLIITSEVIMKEFVFDIETAGYKWEDIDENVQKYLIKRQGSLEDAKGILGLNPLVSKIIVISIMDIEQKKIFTFMESENNDLFSAKDKKELEGKYEIIYKTGDERTIIEYFWHKIAECNKYITYNGRSFDIPFILHRSMFHRIKPTRKLMTNRYYADTHFDIYDMLTFYNATYGYSLEMWCRTMGISNPKEKGLDGSKVGEYYHNGKIEEIAAYCNRDVIATAELDNRVKMYYK